MTYSMNEIMVMIERMNEMDRFESRGRPTEPWIQADAEFLLDETTDKRSGLWDRAIIGTGDILISSGEKLKSWRSP